MKPLKALWRLFLYHPWSYLLNMTLWAIIEVLPLFIPLVIKVILDRMSANSGLGEGYWWLVALLVGIYASRIIFTYWGARGYTSTVFYFDALLRQNMLKAILQRPGAEALPYSSGEILNRFRDDVGTVEDIFSWFEDTVGKLLFAIPAVVILLSINTRLTLFVCLPLFIVLAMVQQVRKRVRKYREASRVATGRVIGALGEIFGAVQAIKVTGAEKHMIGHFQKLNHERHKATLKDTVFTRILESALDNVTDLGSGFILLLAAKSMRSGDFSIGDFALFTAYWSTIANFTDLFGAFMSAYQQTRVSLERLFDLVRGVPKENLVKHEPLHITGTLPMPELSAEVREPLKSLEVCDLSYQFAGSENGVKNVNLTVKGGTFTVVTGRVGSGKSTLLRVMLGLLPKDHGTIRWNGQIVDNPESFFAPPFAAYTGQIPHLFSDTVRNNILLGQMDEGQDVSKAVHSAVLEQDVATFERGLETVIGPRGVKLSGGQLQRVAAARMFASNAQLYLFDDISSALDVETENLLWKRLFESKDVTCIAVSNRRAALQQADQIILMKDGQVEASGTLEELLEISEEMRQIYGRNAQSA